MTKCKHLGTSYNLVGFNLLRDLVDESSLQNNLTQRPVIKTAGIKRIEEEPGCDVQQLTTATEGKALTIE